MSRPSYLGTNVEDRSKPKFSFSVIIRMYQGIEQVQNSAEAPPAEPTQSKVLDSDEEMDRLFRKQQEGAGKTAASEPVKAAKGGKGGKVVRTAFFVTVVRNPKFSPDIHIHPWLFNTFRPLEDQTRIE